MNIRTKIKQLLSSKLLVSAFLNKTYSLTTFQPGLDNFGIILKGRSVEKLPQVSEEFDDCFIVNNFDPEMELVGNSLSNKNVVHFVCRTMTTPMTPGNYKKLNIKEVQLSKSSALRDRALLYAISHYQSLGLKTVFLPKHLLNISNNVFGPHWPDCNKKFPNTGHAAIYYAIKIIKPRNLWIIGLDFYQNDYLVRRSHLSPIEMQRTKMKRVNAVEVVKNWIKESPHINFNMVTYYDGFDPQPNLNVM